MFRLQGRSVKDGDASGKVLEPGDERSATPLWQSIGWTTSLGAEEVAIAYRRRYRASLDGWKYLDRTNDSQ